MTPLQIFVLLKTHVHGQTTLDINETWRKQTMELDEAGMVAVYPDGKVLPTEKGRAFVDIVCMLPYPTAAWSLPVANMNLIAPHRGTTP